MTASVTLKLFSRSRRWPRLWLSTYSATSVRVRTTRLWVAPFISISSRPRSNCSATEDTERTWPLPPHCGQGSVELSSTLARMRWRGILRQAEMRDASDLDAGAVLPQAVAELALDRAIVALLVHVDEVDDDQAGEVAQAQLAGDLVGCLDVGLERRVLDVVPAGGAPGVDVDRDQRLGLVDHDVAARAQLDDRREHRVELALDAVAGEDRLALVIGLHV